MKKFLLTLLALMIISYVMLIIELRSTQIKYREELNKNSKFDICCATSRKCVNIKWGVK